jgi:hypothetical protein
MADPVSQPVREPGWYRLAERGWERVPDAEAEAELAAGGWDLVHVAVDAAAEAPLF